MIREELAQALKESDGFGEPRTKLIWTRRRPNHECVLLEPVERGQLVQAVPGAGVEVEVWILGSSLFGAQLAAMLGLPYAFAGQMGVTEVMGNSPYGASTIAGGDGSRQPSEVELAGARYQGRHVAEIATKLAR